MPKTTGVEVEEAGGIGRSWIRQILVLSIAAGSVAAWLYTSREPQAARPTNGRTVIAFGDSLVAGHGATPGRDFVTVLSRRLGTSILNAGVNGDTAGSALARLDRDVLARDPRVVIVLLGGNDYLRGVPREVTFRNLGTIVDRIRRHGAAVVLVGVSVGIIRDSYADEYESLARRTSAGLVPGILDNILGRADRMSDSIHPNDVGYEMMAARIEPVLREVLRIE